MAAGRPTPTPRPDLFAVWFGRAVNLTGLFGFLYELVITGQNREWVLLLAGAMMLGGYGLSMFVRGATAVVNQTQLPQDEEPE